MTVCKQPVATLALNATSTYVSMIRVWGEHLLLKKKKLATFGIASFFLLVILDR